MIYNGGKGGSGVVQTIINQMPPHNTYIEPFLGGGAVMRHKRPAQVNIGVELNPDVVDEWNGRVIQSLMTMWADTVSNDYTEAQSEMTIAARIAKNGYVGQHSRSQLCELIGTARNDYGAAKVSYQVVCGNALAWLDSYAVDASTFIYCDPPYMMSTRSTQRRIYKHEMYTEEEHGRLLNLLRKLPAMIAISGYDSDFYDAMLYDWRKISYSSQTRNGMATECLWMNYEEPRELHDYRYLGDNYTERQRIKRKKQRWAAKWSSMPQLERYAILGAIQEVEQGVL